jgi:hypothetical protein
MPYGVRADASGLFEVDFDELYQSVLLPTIEAAGGEAIRSDHEVDGGLIHTSMFERLLLADIVIADVSLPNPNVFYELGIRHATRPRATITMGCTSAAVPFDVAPLRHLRYELSGRGPADPEALGRQLLERVQAALSDTTATDSPLFQTVLSEPGIELSHEVAESYRDRVSALVTLRRDLAVAVARIDPGEISRIEIAASGATELLADVMLAYRDVEAWSDMIRVIESSRALSQSTTGIEQSAFARNRRNDPEDRRRALVDLQLLEQSAGVTSERASLRGRIYKDLWLDERSSRGDQEAFPYLIDAISAYRSGLEADPRDPLPGVNLCTLLALAKFQEQLRAVTPVVAFALARRGGLRAREYFDLAALCELSCVIEDGATAHEAAMLARGFKHPAWARHTTARNLRILAEVRPLAGELANLFATTDT